MALVATSADSVPSSYLVRITIAPIGTTFGNLQWRRYYNNFTFEYSSNNNIFSFVAMSADSVPSSKTNILQNKLIYCRYFRTYSRCAMFDWSDTVFRRRNVTRRRISNTVLQPRYWGRETDSPEVCRLGKMGEWSPLLSSDVIVLCYGFVCVRGCVQHRSC
jgi:hypothetical protein